MDKNRIPDSPKDLSVKVAKLLLLRYTTLP